MLSFLALKEEQRARQAGFPRRSATEQGLEKVWLWMVWGFSLVWQPAVEAIQCENKELKQESMESTLEQEQEEQEEEQGEVDQYHM